VIELKGYHYYRDDRMKPTERANWEKQNYVRRTLLENIENGSVVLPADLAGTGATFTFKELGIGFPMMISGKSTPVKIPNPEYYRITGKPMPGSETGGGTMGGSGGMGMGPASSGGGTPGTASGGGNSSAAAGLDEGGSSSEGGGAVGGSGGLGGGGGVGGVVKNEKGEVVPPSFDVEKYEFVVQFCWLEKPLSKRVEERLKAEAEAKQKADEAAGAAPAVEDSAAAGVP
jgi:hypothetical protein